MQLNRIGNLQHAADVADGRQVAIGNFDRLRAGVLHVQADQQALTRKALVDAGRFKDQHGAVAGPRLLDVRFDNLETVFSGFEDVHAASAGIDRACIKVNLRHWSTPYTAKILLMMLLRSGYSISSSAPLRSLASALNEERVRR